MALDTGSGKNSALWTALSGLAAIMESHFGYEERAISDAIDEQLQDTGWTTAVFEFRT